MEDHDRNLRVTLQEIERLMAAAEQSGSPVPAWFAQLAMELRAATPARARSSRTSPSRILSDPRLSLGAQADLPIPGRCGS